MKHIANLLGMILATILLAGVVAAEGWKPEAKFSLEGGTLKQTMLWISGFSYAVDAIGKGRNGNSRNRPFCSPENGHIGSQILFEILNSKFEGQTITSEQATREIMSKLPGRFPC